MWLLDVKCWRASGKVMIRQIGFGKIKVERLGRGAQERKKTLYTREHTSLVYMQYLSCAMQPYPQIFRSLNFGSYPYLL